VRRSGSWRSGPPSHTSTGTANSTNRCVHPITFMSHQQSVRVDKNVCPHDVPTPTCLFLSHLSPASSALSLSPYHPPPPNLSPASPPVSQVEEGLSRHQTASIHGSLLIIGEMLSHTGDFMVPRFQEVRRHARRKSVD
jgi:hypothetical protein